jgi:hypothetical protein
MKLINSCHKSQIVGMICIMIYTYFKINDLLKKNNWICNFFSSTKILMIKISCKLNRVWYYILILKIQWCIQLWIINLMVCSFTCPMTFWNWKIETIYNIFHDEYFCINFVQLQLGSTLLYIINDAQPTVGMLICLHFFLESYNIKQNAMIISILNEIISISNKTNNKLQFTNFLIYNLWGGYL